MARFVVLLTLLTISISEAISICNKDLSIFSDDAMCQSVCGDCTSATKSTTNASACDTTKYRGFIAYNGKTYALTKQSAFYSDFQEKDKFIVIHDETINNIATYMTKYYNTNAWIGLFDPNYSSNYNQIYDSRFIWRDGSRIDYKNFEAGQPNNFVANEDIGVVPKLGEHWVEIDTTGKWKDNGYHTNYQNYKPLRPAIVEFPEILDCVNADITNNDTIGDFFNKVCNGSNCKICIQDENMQQCENYNNHYLCPINKTQCQSHTIKNCPSNYTYDPTLDLCVANQTTVSDANMQYYYYKYNSNLGQYYYYYYPCGNYINLNLNLDIYYTNGQMRTVSINDNVSLGYYIHRGYQSRIDMATAYSPIKIGFEIKNKLLYGYHFGWRYDTVCQLGLLFCQGKSNSITTNDSNSLYYIYRRESGADYGTYIPNSYPLYTASPKNSSCGYRYNEPTCTYNTDNYAHYQLNLSQYGTPSKVVVRGRANYIFCVNSYSDSFTITLDLNTCPSGGSYNSALGKCTASPITSLGYKCPLGDNYSCVDTGSGYYCSNVSCVDQGSVSGGQVITDTEEGVNDKKADGQIDSNGNCLGTIYIFNGQDRRCRPPGIQTMFTDCCKKEKMSLLGISLGSCKSQEIYLSKLRQWGKLDGQCHYVGSYCAEKWPLIGCVQKKKTYCCFSSPLSRIIQEQGRPQLGIGWGSPESPNCRGFTIEEFQKLDFSKIDFSEYIEYTVNQTLQNSINKANQTIENTLQNIKNSYQ